MSEPREVRVATAQFYSHTNVPENLELCRRYIHQAAEAGAQLIVLPENSNRCRSDYTSRERAYELCEDVDDDFVRGLQATAKELNIFIVAGVDIKTSVSPKCHIAVLLISNVGDLTYVHHKTVLWDCESLPFFGNRRHTALTGS